MAAGDTRIAYGTSNQSITITLNSLASSATAGRASTYVDNATNKFIDAICTITIDLPAGTPANDRAVYVYVYGTADGGTTYTGRVTGTDAAYTDTDPSQFGMPVAVVPALATGGVYSRTFSVAQAFGGILPERWGLFVRNFSGLTLDSSGNSVHYQGVINNTES